MSAVKFTKCKEKSFLSMDIHRDRIQFDYPAEIYGKNHRIGDKPILVKVKAVNAKKIFVSSNDALGIFFLKKDVPIYVTKPVYEQLVLRLKDLQGYLVHYDEEGEKADLYDVNEVDIARTERNVIFVTYNEIIYFDAFMVEVVSSNTFLGWCNFILHIQKKRLAYISTFSLKGRISFKMAPTNLHMIILNQHKINIHELGLDDFLQVCQDNAIKIIPVDVSSMFLELFLFLLNTTKDMSIQICVVSPFYMEINRAVNGCGKWLNKKFKIDQHDPLPLSIKNVTCYNALSDISGLEDNSIVFCTKEEFDITNNSIDSCAYYRELIERMDKKTYETDEDDKQLKSMRTNEENTSDENSEEDERIKNIRAVFNSTDKNVLIDFVIASILKGDTVKAKHLFNRKYVVLNVMNYDMESDYAFNLNLCSTIPEMRSFYGNPVIASNMDSNLEGNDVFMTNEEIYVIDIPKIDYYVYNIKNVERIPAGNNLLLFDGKIRNERLICRKNQLKKMFRETYYLHDGIYFFPGLRKRVWFESDKFYITDY
ncbi:hypothetical protein VCUG_01065 [Vavraia culicis subsp. floridensis]|uniref:Uncharacterized protein n=1 Tax=Vavraia culicis (isolate floridensis) TaxID=948595 RepID=L2GUX4_VAVCU|nr:uncharacterized protein VCUG_01065 [Vavraia culicis subsp. floridensis]ELA47414.1 hypothetical protein VCUG_01065 [Vavraia culicis subsp. floridensis]